MPPPGAGVSAARDAGLEAAAKLPVLSGCPLLVLPDGPGWAPKPSFWRRLQRRHTGHGLWGARLASHQEGSCGCSAWPGLVRACSTSPPAAQAGKAAALGWGHIVAWPCLTRAPGQCAPDTDLRPEVTGAAVPCSAWVRLCVPHPGPGDTQQGLGPRLLAAGLAGREYTSWLGSGEGGQDVRTACGEAGAMPGASGSLGAALALQALGLQGWPSGLEGGPGGRAEAAKARPKPQAWHAHMPTNLPKLAE